MAKSLVDDTLDLGLDFLGDDDLEAPGNAAMQTLPIGSIRPDPNQPRKQLTEAVRYHLLTGTIFDAWRTLQEENHTFAEGIRSLADNIAVVGLLSPISVREVGGSWTVVLGERRWWAHVHLASQVRGGDPDYPIAVTVTQRDDSQTIIAQIAENLQREDVTAIETGYALRMAVEEQGVSERQLSDALGMDKDFVNRHIQLVKYMPEEAIQLALEHRLTEGALRAVVNKRVRRMPDLQNKVVGMLCDSKVRRTAEEIIDIALAQGVENVTATAPPHTKLVTTAQRLVNAYEKMPDEGWASFVADPKAQEELVAVRDLLNSILEQAGKV